MGTEYRCECCGHIIEPRPNGKPSCILWSNQHGYETVVCLDCMQYRTDRVDRLIEANKAKTWEDMQYETD